MSLVLHPSWLQQTLETLNPVTCNIREIHELHTVQEQAQKEMLDTFAKIKTLESNISALPKEVGLSNIAKLSAKYTQFTRKHEETKKKFWPQAIRFWTHHKNGRSNLLSTLYPISMGPASRELRTRFITNLKTELQATQSQSFNPVWETPKTKLPVIQEKSVKYTCYSPRKKQKSI